MWFCWLSKSRTLAIYLCSLDIYDCQYFNHSPKLWFGITWSATGTKITVLWFVVIFQWEKNKKSEIFTPVFGILIRNFLTTQINRMNQNQIFRCSRYQFWHIKKKVFKEKLFGGFPAPFPLQGPRGPCLVVSVTKIAW